MPRTCARCGDSINLLRDGAQYCSARCRVAAKRDRDRKAKLPAAMTSARQWVRRDKKKRPVRADNGRWASVTNPESWCTYEEAKKSKRGAGLGFVLTADDDISCIDLDHCIHDGQLDPRAQKLIEGTPNKLFVEISQSGEGVHIWHTGGPGRGSRRRENGLLVERYSQGRYIAVTGKLFEV